MVGAATASYETLVLILPDIFPTGNSYKKSSSGQCWGFSFYADRYIYFL
jgi:hypothetical protein